MTNEFHGTISNIRAVEDAIRATHKYTEGMVTRFAHHPPVQGGETASKVLTKHYEVYPDVVVDIDMPASQAVDWLWGELDMVNVNFWYNYRDRRATMRVNTAGSTVREELRKLAAAVPGLCDLLLVFVQDRESREMVEELKTAVGKSMREDWYMPEAEEDTKKPDKKPEEKKPGLLDRFIPSRRKAG